MKERTQNVKRTSPFWLCLFKKQSLVLFLSLLGLLLLFLLSLFIGKYPLSLRGLLEGQPQQWRVFLTLRFSRSLAGLIGGLCLGMTGYVYQTIFQNPIASPDIIGVASGASAGAAFGILFFNTTLSITLFAFVGALVAMCCAILFSLVAKREDSGTLILCGLSIHSLAQTLLLFLKLTADPEKELASIEYWMMGSLNAISLSQLLPNMLLCLISLILLFLLHRQIILLSSGTVEAKMLGVSVTGMRLLVLLLSTLAVASVISMTGLISFIGLIAPHIARFLLKENKKQTLLLSGILGGMILLLSDLFARGLTSSELPVSLFTSLLGAPMLLHFAWKRRRFE